jgi:hypothetical protein
MMRESAPLSDFTITTPPSHDELRRRVRQNIGRLDAGLRVIAEDVPGLATRIDLIALDENGDVVLILIVAQAEDLQGFTRALAERAWMEPRLESWRKLAPDLNLHPGARTRCLLVAPNFALETRIAADAQPKGLLGLATWRYVASDAQRTVWLESVSRCERIEQRPSAPAHREDKRIPSFRSGLSESDLGLTAEENDQLE